jgi:hypothetical protein
MLPDFQKLLCVFDQAAEFMLIRGRIRGNDSVSWQLQGSANA